MVMPFCGQVPHFSYPLLLYIGCRTFPIYDYFWDVVTHYNTVFTSDTSLAVAFALPLSYFTGLKYTVQSSYAPVLYPQSSTFCVDSSLPYNGSFSLSASSPSSLSYLSTYLVPRSNLVCPVSSTFCIDPSPASNASSYTSASASSASTPSYTLTSLTPSSNLSSSPAAHRCWLAVGDHCTCHFRHLHRCNSHCPQASWNAVCRLCNCCLSGCLGPCFWSQVPQVPLRRSNTQQESHCQHALLPHW